ncbi:MAG: hypothetical protein QM604_05560, partial [Microbacterium sp.]
MTMWMRERRDRRTVGEWSFELRDDEIADLAYRGRIALRSVRAVVRDRDWDTAAWTVGAIETDASTLLVPLRTDRPGAEIVGELRASASGRQLRISFDAVSVTAFATNRTGLVVLHPPQLAGAALTARHTDGTVSRTAFPTDIAPHQPVLDIAGIDWSHDGLDVALTFEGDVFEMEDQRNWTDASYKTYSRPLALPFPYELAAGERIVQSVTVAAAEAAPLRATSRDQPIVLRPGAAFPAVSVGAATAPDPAPRPAEP